MDFSSLTAKVVLGTLGVAGTGGTGYLVWDNVFNTGLTEFDNGLLDKIKEFSSVTVSNESTDNPSSITVTNTSPNIKLIFTKTTDQTKIELKFEATGSKEIFKGMKKWECVIEGNVGNEHKTKSLDDQQVNNLKTSFGFTTGTTSLTQKHKNSISKFVKSCAYWGERKVKLSSDSEKKLTRNIKMDVQISNNKLQFSNLEKFFIPVAK